LLCYRQKSGFYEHHRQDSAQRPGNHSNQRTAPGWPIRRRLGELRFSASKIIITPRALIDRSQFPNGDDEYTPAQRSAIDRGIAQSEKEYQQGKGLGPFESPAEFIASVHKDARKLGSKKNKPAA